MKTGYSIRTWRMRLFCSEKQILAETEKLYCEAVAFYYELLKDRNELWTENLLTIQGQLEKLTVPGKDGRVPEYLPPGGKLPVYFRRSAMNKASMAVKTAAASGCFETLEWKENGSGRNADLQDALFRQIRRYFHRLWFTRENG